MNIETENYFQAQERLPDSGQKILGFQDADSIVVYQAYNKNIAEFAVKNQFLGGSHFSYNRMSWIKPNFLWMMYRCGWAEKENQEKVLALWIEKTDFEEILSQAVFSSFNPKFYQTEELWKKELSEKEVRLQWDPDHDAYGGKLKRRAIQLGLKGKALENFGKRQVKRIEDITDFVREQKRILDDNSLEKLLVPFETVFIPKDADLSLKIGLD